MNGSQTLSGHIGQALGVFVYGRRIVSMKSHVDQGMWHELSDHSLGMQYAGAESRTARTGPVEDVGPLRVSSGRVSRELVL